LHEEGFSVLKAIGGAARIDDGPWELHWRIAVYAPGPYERAMKMLNFPNRPKIAFAPDPWVPKDVTSFLSFSWDMQDVLTSFGLVVDQITGKKGDFEAIIKAMKNDPD